jgi:maltooligosyltrehalose trehalohydrolase
MRPLGGGTFQAHVPDAGAGTLYRYFLNDEGPFPDPASRFQPRGVYGPSEVIDWTQYRWSDDGWGGGPFEDLVIYELHVGAFVPAGSFLGVVHRLPHLADLGVTAIELMPVAAFPGRHNWGYDGVALFAPACEYGRPADLQRLVDRAHQAGIAVLVDVVYNHLGPDGAYLPAFNPEFFSPRHKSPWGNGVNLDGPGSENVRRFIIENALHWVHEYHVDGLRLDATHALVDASARHLLAELADAIHGLDFGRSVHLIAEDERNLATLVRPKANGGRGLDGVWADDFHHEMHRALTGEDAGYYADFSGTAADIARTINQGWFYTGQHSNYAGGPRGSGTEGIDRRRFVFCLQNHDQVGNRALGERLSRLADLAACRAAATLLLLAPETPLLFMGEEWAASTPFLYFTDHHRELGRLVTEGRRREFERFPAFKDPGARRTIPDPQEEATFEASCLRWGEVEREPHASMLRLYRTLIALRRGQRPIAELGRREAPAAQALDDRTVMVRAGDNDALLVVAHLKGAGRVIVPTAGSWRVALTTEDPAFAPGSRRPAITSGPSPIAIEYAGPCAVVFTRARGDQR